MDMICLHWLLSSFNGKFFLLPWKFPLCKSNLKVKSKMTILNIPFLATDRHCWFSNLCSPLEVKVISHKNYTFMTFKPHCAWSFMLHLPEWIFWQLKKCKNVANKNFSIMSLKPRAFKSPEKLQKCKIDIIGKAFGFIFVQNCGELTETGETRLNLKLNKKKLLLICWLKVYKKICTDYWFRFPMKC